MSLEPNVAQLLLNLIHAQDSDSLDNTALFQWVDANRNVLGKVNTSDASWTLTALTNTPLDQLLLQSGMSISLFETLDSTTPLFFFTDSLGYVLPIGNSSTGSSTEVIDARGTAVDLNTRLSQSMTPEGSPKTAVENLSRLYNWRSICTWFKLSGTGLAHVILDGDSWWDGHTYGSTNAIARFFADSGFPSAGFGWCGFAAATQGSTPHGDAQNLLTVTRDANWTDLFVSAAATPLTPQNYPGYDACQASAANATITIAGSSLSSLTSLTLYCGKGSSISYSWNGGTSYTALSITSGTGSTTVAIPLSGATTTLKLQAASGSVMAGMFGQSASSGVIFSNLSSSGSTAQQHASVATNSDFIAMMQTLPGSKTVFVQLGLNDAKGGAGLSSVQGFIASVVTGYQTTYPGCDVMIFCQPDTALNESFNMDALSPLLRYYAENNDCAFLDWQNFFGPISSPTTYSAYTYTSSRPFLENVTPSPRHPSTGTAICGANLVSDTLSNIFLSPLRVN